MNGTTVLYDNPLYRRALAHVVQALPKECCLSGSVLITGASGLIGSAVVDVLLYLREVRQMSVSVVAVGRSVARLRERFGTRDGLSFVAYDELLNGSVTGEMDALILAASPASPDFYVNDPTSVFKANTEDVRQILGQISPVASPRVVYVSSSEVYGNSVAPDGGHQEDERGEIDASNVRTCYARAKRAAEAICLTCGFPHVMIARPGHVYGPTAMRADKRVSSCWPYDVAAGRNIVMKSEGTQLRSYTHCLDAATAILTILAKGMDGEAYNISNRDSIITIRQMAELLVSAAGVRLVMELPTSQERAAFNPMQDSSLNAAKLEALGWKGVIDAKTGFGELVKIVRSCL